MPQDARKEFTVPRTEQERFRRSNRKRIIYSSIGAVIILVLVIVFGPSGKDVRRTWEFPGREGPLKLMPELSIDEGSDAVHMDAGSKSQASRAAPNYEPTVPEAIEKVPLSSPVSTSDETTEILPETDPELEMLDAVKMRLPAQTNPWFRLIRMVRPRYPADAADADLQQPQVVVEVAFYVNESGHVDGSYIMSNTGGQAYARVVLKAVEQWLYEPLLLADGRKPQGFWNRLKIFFRTPLDRVITPRRGNPGQETPPGVD